MPCITCPADMKTQDGAVVCIDCVAATHSPCPGCDEWHPRHATCTSCIDCYHCNRAVAPHEARRTVDRDQICRECQRSYYWQCHDCEAWNPDSFDRCGNDCCPQDCCCEDCAAADDYPIHAWHYKPRPMFHGTGPLFLGVEIEIDTPHYDIDECAGLARSRLGTLGYLKEDSSIDNGFEIVTHPMSYEWAVAHFPWTMLTELAQAGCDGDNNGMHVHVSRAGFGSPCHTYRWMKFIHRNQQQVVRIARRSSAGWAAFTDEDRRAVKHYAKGGRGERYRAINTGNPDTFELRVFASSLDIGEVQAALAFAAASIEYTRRLTVPLIAGGGWTWSAFAAWVADRPAYTPLRAQLEALACVC